jgi:TRAP-type uncharacterized transport system substrate-binding protein
MKPARLNHFFRTALTLVACSVFPWTLGTGSGYGQTKVTITTAPVGGAWYPIGGAMANIITKAIPGTVSTVQPGGGISNIFLVGGGKAEIGFGFPGDVADAQKGVDDFKGKPVANIRAITPLYFRHHRRAPVPILSPSSGYGYYFSPFPSVPPS